MQIDNFPFANLDELETAVRLATEAAIYHKADPETVYVNGRLVLVKEFLTDGSEVFNIVLIRE